METFFGF